MRHIWREYLPAAEGRLKLSNAQQANPSAGQEIQAVKHVSRYSNEDRLTMLVALVCLICGTLAIGTSEILSALYQLRFFIGGMLIAVAIYLFILSQRRLLRKSISPN
jgi:hypothetical protein